MKTVLKIMKKGFNDNYRYTEYFLHNAFQYFGYNLTRDEKTADFSVTAYINSNEKYFFLTSPFFDKLHGEECSKLCEVVPAEMKSDVTLYPQHDEIILPNASVHRFLYSSISNAYNEPALVEKGISKLEIEGKHNEINIIGAGQPGNLGFKVVNYGGPAVGLNVIIQAPFLSAPFLSVESATIHRYTTQWKDSHEMTFQKSGNRFICSLENYEILPGRNKMSALWCRTRSKYQCAEFFINFKLRNKSPLRTKILITVTPFSGEGATTEFTL